MAAENKRQGIVEMEEGIPWSERALAQSIGLTVISFRKVLLELQTYQPGGFAIDDKGIISFSKWDQLQFAGDDSRQRVQDYRDRIRASGDTATGYTKHREALMEEAGGRCVYCGSDEKLVIDHLIPRILFPNNLKNSSKLSLNSKENLAISCKKCNSGKAGRTPEMAGYSFMNTDVERRYSQLVSRLSRLQSQPVTEERQRQSTEEDTIVSKDTVAGENVKAVFAGLKDRRGYASPKGAAEGAAARQMLKWGLTPEEILECWDEKKTEPFWIDKELWMMTISGQIQAWKANKKRGPSGETIGDTARYRREHDRQGR
ncbi:MAG: HNH endonuclease signature motif containing protein [Chloroflexota bacterium]